LNSANVDQPQADQQVLPRRDDEVEQRRVVHQRGVDVGADVHLARPRRADLLVEAADEREQLRVVPLRDLQVVVARDFLPLEESLEQEQGEEERGEGAAELEDEDEEDAPPAHVRQGHDEQAERRQAGGGDEDQVEHEEREQAQQHGGNTPAVGGGQAGDFGRDDGRRRRVERQGGHAKLLGSAQKTEGRAYSAPPIRITGRGTAGTPFPAGSRLRCGPAAVG
jgi:hypothetical protein